jgi:ribosomal 30S subunit maturation factor RimM
MLASRSLRTSKNVESSTPLRFERSDAVLLMILSAESTWTELKGSPVSNQEAKRIGKINEILDNAPASSYLLAQSGREWTFSNLN